MEKRKNDLSSTYNKKEEQDLKDFELILEAYNFKGYDKGRRGIHMRLLHMGVLMNHKKITRLMKKFNLFCPIRKANPARRMAKALKTSNYADNILKRHFDEYGPGYVLETDITIYFMVKTFKSLSFCGKRWFYKTNSFICIVIFIGRGFCIRNNKSAI